MNIASLGYLGLESQSLEFWGDTLPPIFGLEVAEASDRVVRLRLDEHQHRVSIHRSARNGIAYLGWELATLDDLEEAKDVLSKRGTPFEEGSDTLLADRGVEAVIAFSDPVGFRQELFYGPLIGSSQFRPARPHGGFVTGEMGLGHVSLVVPNSEVAQAFYRDVFGFRLTDEIGLDLPGGVHREFVFFHTNPRHHSLALAPMPGLRGLHHLMVQVESIDDVGIAYDLCAEQGLAIEMKLGRHINDHMLSFYLRTPVGCHLEYGWGGRSINDETWTTVRYEEGSVWGHQAGSDTRIPGAVEPVA